MDGLPEPSSHPQCNSHAQFHNSFRKSNVYIALSGRYVFRCSLVITLKSTILLQTVNLMRRIERPLPDHIIGSLIWHFKIPTKDIQRNEAKIGVV
ncbi:hypothetical protein FEM48_Zijuj10G0040600 [Ziziphus jujuba var. spinosa]|uniref:Uncharacterized protein n=1 Tax=Ziziphus jujuba var. spinosa TaxID=714518 RepID=A0A978UL67_ZIZJJ|nr:hypothetical protein FEM48_Zijuj10G0040600 [Ziziphus jujuba var. spinosa]